MGPIEFVVVGFPGTGLHKEIGALVAELAESRMARIVDLVVVRKDPGGDLIALEIAELEPEERAAYEAVDGELDGMLSDEDLALAGEILDPGDTAVLLVWEDLWASRLHAAVRRAAGEVIVHQRFDAEVADAVMAAAV